MPWQRPYIDPGQLNKGPDYDPLAPPLSLVNPSPWGGEGWGQEITPERQERNMWEAALAKGTEPGLEDTTFQALMDAAMLAPVAGMGLRAARGAAGKLGQGGFINWPSGHSYSDAFLHRSLSANELPFLESLFARGKSTQAPTTPVAPNLLTVFQNSPRGLLFNVEDPAVIKFASPDDAWSVMRLDPSSPQTNAADRLYDIVNGLREEALRLHGEGRPIPRALRTKIHRYIDAQDKMESEASRIWEPGMRHLHSNRDWQSRSLKNLLEEPMLVAEGSQNLRHSEIIPQISRDMLAGVKLPWRRYDLGGVTDLTKFAKGIGRTPEEVIGEATQRQAAVDEPFLRFADKFNLPIFRWPIDWNAGQQAKMLENPWAGKWLNKGDYITSSEIARLLGNVR